MLDQLCRENRGPDFLLPMDEFVARHAEGNQARKIAVLHVVENVMNVMVALALWLAAKTTDKIIALADLILNEPRKRVLVGISKDAAPPTRVIAPHVLPDVLHRIGSPSLKEMLFSIEGVACAALRTLFGEGNLAPRFSGEVLAVVRVLRTATPRSIDVALHPLSFGLNEFGAILGRLHVGAGRLAFRTTQKRIDLGAMHGFADASRRPLAAVSAVPGFDHTGAGLLLERRVGPTRLCRTRSASEGLLSRNRDSAILAFVHFVHPSNGYYKALPSACQ